MAESLIYVHRASAITWRSSGGSAAFTPPSLATVSGRQGAYYDLGTTAAPADYYWRAFIKPGATRVVGEIVRVYLATGNGTVYDNDDGTGDIAVSAFDKLRNCKQIGEIVIDENAAVTMSASGTVTILSRYVAPIFWNLTANTLSSTAGDFGFDLEPVPSAIQAEA